MTEQYIETLKKGDPVAIREQITHTLAEHYTGKITRIDRGKIKKILANRVEELQEHVGSSLLERSPTGDLSDEALWEILLEMDGVELLMRCQAIRNTPSIETAQAKAARQLQEQLNQRIKNLVCKNENFWQEKFLRDFPLPPSTAKVAFKEREQLEKNYPKWLQRYQHLVGLYEIGVRSHYLRKVEASQVVSAPFLVISVQRRAYCLDGETERYNQKHVIPEQMIVLEDPDTDEKTDLELYAVITYRDQHYTCYFQCLVKDTDDNTAGISGSRNMRRQWYYYNDLGPSLEPVDDFLNHRNKLVQTGGVLYFYDKPVSRNQSGTNRFDCTKLGLLSNFGSSCYLDSLMVVLSVLPQNSLLIQHLFQTKLGNRVVCRGTSPQGDTKLTLTDDHRRRQAIRESLSQVRKFIQGNSGETDQCHNRNLLTRLQDCDLSGFETLVSGQYYDPDELLKILFHIFEVSDTAKLNLYRMGTDHMDLSMDEVMETTPKQQIKTSKLIFNSIETVPELDLRKFPDGVSTQELLTRSDDTIIGRDAIPVQRGNNPCHDIDRAISSSSTKTSVAIAAANADADADADANTKVLWVQYLDHPSKTPKPGTTQPRFGYTVDEALALVRPMVPMTGGGKFRVGEDVNALWIYTEPAQAYPARVRAVYQDEKTKEHFYQVLWTEEESISHFMSENYLFAEDGENENKRDEEIIPDDWEELFDIEDIGTDEDVDTSDLALALSRALESIEANDLEATGSDIKLDPGIEALLNTFVESFQK